MRPRLGTLLVLFSLLPGLGLAPVGELRLCLAALVGGAECCSAEADEPACCSQPSRGADPLARGQDADPCGLCCLELEDEAGVASVAPRGEAEPALAAPPASRPLRLARAPARAPSLARTSLARPRPARNLPLRI